MPHNNNGFNPILTTLIDQWAADRPARRLDADRVRQEIEARQAREQRTQQEPQK